MIDHTALLLGLREYQQFVLPPMLTEAADAIEALLAERDRLREELAAGEQAFHEEADTVAGLREELAAVQKDAARYRWLADAEPFSARWQIVRLEWWRGKDGWEPVAKGRLDAAIDAAMGGER